MTDTVVIYASSVGGHVEKTAKYIAKALGADTFDLKKQTKINMDEYSRVILGTFIHAGKPSSKVVAFAGDNKAELSKKKTSLFICCMFGGEKGTSQCESVSEQTGIADATFFVDKSEKNEAGVSKDVDAYIERMKN